MVKHEDQPESPVLIRIPKYQVALDWVSIGFVVALCVSTICLALHKWLRDGSLPIYLLPLFLLWCFFFWISVRTRSAHIRADGMLVCIEGIRGENQEWLLRDWHTVTDVSENRTYNGGLKLGLKTGSTIVVSYAAEGYDEAKRMIIQYVGEHQPGLVSRWTAHTRCGDTERDSEPTE